MSGKKFFITFSLEVIFLVIIGFCLGIVNRDDTSEAISLTLPPASTPLPFLGTVYYGRWDVLNVFDHDLPWASVGEDDNDYVTHYNGVEYSPPITQGYGYDQHAGIDYDLEYVPVLAVADGTVTIAGWNNPANHRAGYGLYVTINHGDYRTIYGHLSALTVQVGDEVSPSPEKSVGIIGVSGNTGSVLGGCGDVEDDPLCAAHLHFEVRKATGYTPVNPYGWVSQTINDPWPTVEPEAISYPIWVTPPALIGSADQYPGSNSSPVLQPPPLLPVRTIHNEDEEYQEVGDCWADLGSGGNLFGSWRGALARESGVPYCEASWSITPNGVTSAGEYDLYAYIPQTSGTITLTRGAEYMIYANGGSEVRGAIAVQAAYAHPANGHSPWVYLGRYYFRMDGGDERVELTNVTFRPEETDSGWGDQSVYVVAADAIRLVRVGGPRLYLSGSSSGSVGGVAFENEDIVVYDPSNRSWEMVFDGSDVGLGGGTVNVEGVEWLADGDLLLSFNETVTLNGVGSVAKQDIVRFQPTSLGNDTAGTFELYLDGSDVGLTTSGEEIDAIGLTGDGHLVVSTVGNFTVPGVVGNDEDLLLFTATSLGSNSSGSWELYLDGSDVGLDTNSNEDVDGVWMEGVRGDVLLSTMGAFEVTGSEGNGEDMFGCDPQVVGDDSSCTFEGLFWDGSLYEWGVNVDGVAMFGAGVAGCEGVANCSFEFLAGQQFVDWAEEEMAPFALWQPAGYGHSGNRSAEGVLTQNTGEIAQLLSSPIEVSAGMEYRVSYFLRPNGGNVPSVNLHLVWNGGVVESLQSVELLLAEWVWIDGGFTCPPAGSSAFQLQFTVSINNSTGSVLLDDVRVESRPGNCP